MEQANICSPRDPKTTRESVPPDGDASLNKKKHLTDHENHANKDIKNYELNTNC